MKLVLNGLPESLGARLLQSDFNINTLRPWIGDDKKTYITQNVGGKDTSVLVNNANATLRKDEWIEIDRAVINAARPRLRFVADLRGQGLTYSVPNGLGKMILESEAMSDSSPADISMDALKEGNQDRPEFSLKGLPLPVIHKGFRFSARQIAASRNSGGGLDVTGAEMAGRRVAEMAEQMALGTLPDFNYGGYNIYGLTNFTDSLSQVITDPSDTGWTPAQLIDEVLLMKEKSQLNYYFGPWTIYVSTTWDKYLDKDYSAAKGDNTLRDRLKQIDGITDVKSLDYLPDKKLILVQMTSDVVREVIGLDFTTVQWDEKGGLATNFLVMGILVPQFRADFNSRTGIVVGTYT
jgi:hypothetical protein